MNKGTAAGVIQGCWIMSSIQAAEDQSGKWAIVPTARINHRGDTLGGIVLTIEITSPMPEVIRVKTSHHTLHNGPSDLLLL